MICEKTVKKFCKDFTKIENYDKAIADKTQTWHCHHRLETESTGAVVESTMRDLMDWNIYYDRPPEELIFLTESEHRKLHKNNKNRAFSKEWKDNLSEAHKGYVQSAETRLKRSLAMKGKNTYKRSEEHRQKMKDSSKKGMHWHVVNGKREWY